MKIILWRTALTEDDWDGSVQSINKIIINSRFFFSFTVDVLYIESSSPQNQLWNIHEIVLYLAYYSQRFCYGGRYPVGGIHFKEL